MKIKTYVVGTLSEAYPMILKDLGKEAIIIKTKQVRAPGLFWFLRKKKLEVVAASDLAGETKQGQGGKVLEQAEPIKMTPQLEVLKELSEVKGLIRSMVKGTNTAKVFSKPLEQLVERLRDQEVDEEVVQFILKRLNLKYENIEELKREEIEKNLLAILEQLFDEGIAKDTEESPLLITLVGPTGVGKTTTIAKLAAARVIHHGQRVGLLTTDTYRIAAVDQLKTYATILNAFIKVVKSPDELKPAIDGLKGCQLILMDSAGRNYLEDEYIEDINQYLSSDAPQENYLVLSMTTRWRDMKTIVEKMKSVPIDKLILTKWDETTCYGAALNLVYHFPFPLSFLSMGQRVPQDIMIADASYMAKKVLGVGEHAAGPSTTLETVS
jgi:flagellar biosynthesis protein FlhF